MGNHLLIQPEGSAKDTLSFVGGNRWSLGENEYFFTKGTDGEQYLHIDMICALLSFTKKRVVKKIPIEIRDALKRGAKIQQFIRIHLFVVSPFCINH
jgi:hypothetical protein